MLVSVAEGPVYEAEIATIDSGLGFHQHPTRLSYFIRVGSFLLMKL